MKFLMGLVLCGSLAVLGCSSDSNNNNGGTGGSGGTAGAGGEAGGGGAAGGGGEAGGGGAAGGGGEAGSGGMAGGGGAGGTSAAKAFCDDFEAICGWGRARSFASREDCESLFDNFDSDRQDCVNEHLGFADGGDLDLHCPHASGLAPCN